MMKKRYDEKIVAMTLLIQSERNLKKKLQMSFDKKFYSDFRIKFLSYKTISIQLLTIFFLSNHVHIIATEFRIYDCILKKYHYFSNCFRRTLDFFKNHCNINCIQKQILFF